MTEVIFKSRSTTHKAKDGAPGEIFPAFPKPDLQIGVSRCPLHGASDLHSHDFTELVIAESGVATHHFEGTEHTVGPGDVFVIRPNHAHTFTNTEGFAVSNVLFYEDGSIPLLADMAKLPAYRAIFLLEPGLRQGQEMGGRMHLGFDKLTSTIALVERLEKALDNPDQNSSAIATVCFLQLVKDLCDAYHDAPPRMGTSLIQVSRAISHIENHFCEPIRTVDLANLINLSIRSFQRHFLRATGTTAKRYITLLRIKEARKLLKAGVTVTETAYEAGFEDPNYFSRLFHEEVGINPKEYQIKTRAPVDPPTDQKC